jgi:hypothetical protein
MEKNRLFIPLLAFMIGIALILGFALSYLSSRPWPTVLNVALLYVGGDTGKESTLFEESIQKIVGDMRKKKGIFSGHLPLYSYHFDKPKEREACEGKFGIYRKDLPLLALVEVDDKNLPLRSLYRLRCVTGEEKELSDFLERSVKIMRSEEEGEKEQKRGGKE